MRDDAAWAAFAALVRERFAFLEEVGFTFSHVRPHYVRYERERGYLAVFWHPWEYSVSIEAGTIPERRGRTPYSSWELAEFLGLGEKALCFIADEAKELPLLVAKLAVVIRGSIDRLFPLDGDVLAQLQEVRDEQTRHYNDQGRADGWIGHSAEQ